MSRLIDLELNTLSGDLRESFVIKHAAFTPNIRFPRRGKAQSHLHATTGFLYAGQQDQLHQIILTINYSSIISYYVLLALSL
jgi:hypothetical protein